jgi:hypothetical protein
MGITSPAKERNRSARRVGHLWSRHRQGYSNTPSQQAIECNSRDAYFWRR